MKPSPILGALLLASVAALSLTIAAPAFAKDKSQGAGHGNSAGKAQGGQPAFVQGAPCPPGLAKKGSCVPPGLRKRWAAGEYLPPDLSYRRLSYSEYGLPRPRAGEFYAGVDGDVYLISEATRLVIQAILLGQ